MCLSFSVQEKVPWYTTICTKMSNGESLSQFDVFVSFILIVVNLKICRMSLGGSLELMETYETAKQSCLLEATHNASVITIQKSLKCSVQNILSCQHEALLYCASIDSNGSQESFPSIFLKGSLLTQI